MGGEQVIRRIGQRIDNEEMRGRGVSGGRVLDLGAALKFASAEARHLAAH
jgi:hypothetical protein